MDYKYNALVFKAFCDESRLRIIEKLQEREMCACNLLDVLTISQSTLSHHMKILIESGIVESRKDKKWVYYSLSFDGCENAKRILNQLTISSGEYGACECVE